MNEIAYAIVTITLSLVAVFLPLAFTFQWLFGLYGLFAATLVSNLLVVLCGEHEAQPVINTGTLYS